MFRAKRDQDPRNDCPVQLVPELFPHGLILLKEKSPRSDQYVYVMTLAEAKEFWASLQKQIEAAKGP